MWKGSDFAAGEHRASRIGSRLVDATDGEAVNFALAPARFVAMRTKKLIGFNAVCLDVAKSRYSVDVGKWFYTSHSLFLPQAAALVQVCSTSVSLTWTRLDTCNSL